MRPPKITRVSAGKANATVPGRSREQRLRAPAAGQRDTVGESEAEEGSRVGKDRTGADPRAVAARLDAGTSQRALAAALSAEAGVSISRAAVRAAAARHRALQDRVAAGDLRSKHERRAARRARPAGTDAVVAAQAPERSFEPAPSRPRSDKATGRIGKIILLDRETWEPVGSSASEGYGPAWWLERRDQERAARNDPELQAVQREIDRQTRLAANHGLDPLIPEQAAQIAAIRRAQRPDPLAA